MHDPYRPPESEVERVEYFDTGADEPVEIIEQPWRSIWTRPRATIRYLAATQPTRYVLLLALISGLAQNLNSIEESYLSAGLSTFQLTLFALALAPVTGWISLYLSAVMLRWTGTWLDGRADTQALRCAIAWASVPMIPMLGVIALRFLLLGNEVFLDEPSRLLESASLNFIHRSLLLAQVALSIWYTVLLVKCVAEVQGFSAWRGLANLLLSGVILLLGIVILVFVVVVPFALRGALTQ